MDKSDSNKKKSRFDRRDRWFYSRTLAVMVVCGIVAFGILIGRLFYLQVIKYDVYAEQAAAQQTATSTESVVRGSITDRNGNVLAISEKTSNVILCPYFCDKNEEDGSLIAAELSQVLGVDYNSVLEKLKETDSWYSVVKKQVDSDTADEIQTFIDENSLTGVFLEDSSRRVYPYASLACHILGFVGDENTGLEGVEYNYNSYLTGTSGKTVSLKNGLGSDILTSAVDSTYTSGDGDSIELTIDITIQNIVEKYLEQAVEINDVQNGAACIAMDPNTGEILAMASYGNYDCNDYMELPESIQEGLDAIEDENERSEETSAALLRQWRNKALSDTYEPGSVFKTVTLSMALEENVISDEDAFYCGGYTYVTGREDPIYCSNHDGHGAQTLEQAVENSCNVAFIEIGSRVGAEKFYDYINAFGLFDETGIDLAGESDSIWWDEDVFTNPENLSQLAAASFGQTFTVTPIQMITAVSACCNGGYLMQPYVVKTVTDSDGNTVLLNEPTVKRQVISNETSDKVNEILESVVSDGSGANAYVAGYRIAGKTGTSEKVTENLSSSQKEYIVSFCGYAPANDPQIVVLLLLDTPGHNTGRSISGGTMAAPAVGSIIADILDYMGYEPEYTEEELSAADVYVPDLSGWTKADAIAALDYEGLSYEVTGSGSTVTLQYPEAWSYVAAGSKVRLYFGTDSSEENADEDSTETVTQKMVAVPNLSGLSYTAARDRLEQAGLFIACQSGSIASGMTVGTQYTEAGSEVAYGSVIEVALTDDTLSDD